MRRSETGFTLIELLIVVAIIGVLAAIAIPNLITAMQRAKQKRTMADMRQIGMAWEARAVDFGSYSGAGLSLCCTVPVSITEAHALLDPTFIHPLPERDGWGRDYDLTVNTGGTAYAIRSYARHGMRDTNIVGGGTKELDCDIVYSAGQFVQYPEGVQGQ